MLVSFKHSQNSFCISAQPLGQPEITKKSLDRCPADGNTEVFIIGKNFHRGTKVIFQDPEEADGEVFIGAMCHVISIDFTSAKYDYMPVDMPNSVFFSGSQWSAEGEVDKETFHQVE